MDLILGIEARVERISNDNSKKTHYIPDSGTGVCMRPLLDWLDGRTNQSRIPHGRYYFSSRKLLLDSSGSFSEQFPPAELQPQLRRFGKATVLHIDGRCRRSEERRVGKEWRSL